MLARLPQVRGRLTPMRPLADLCWLRVGGPAEALFQPEDADDLSAFLAALPADVPLTPLGVGSNLIVRDGGLPGVAVRLGRAFMGAEPLEGARLRVGAAMLDSRAAMAAAEAGIAGLEFLRTIPGAIGGAVRMNAGCYGSYTADVLEEITALDRQGRAHRLPASEIGFAYRSSDLPEDWVIVEAILRGAPGERAAIEARMDDYIARREASQPTKDRSCGSTFRNPAGYSSTGEDGDPMDLKAWSLIDRAGMRGATRGGAQISPKHSNFLINAGGATAADLEGLGEEVREKVREAFGIELEWEIKRIGLPS
ncbi:UDP-N-acetylmuramate dehydrogenase [Albimonas sp. CAU 1670]|uniref:UDP-N-acetylmuramate dehydrogenase n=1 Tax=Albimonas sp. CAU 1670 TaxID=3032599 RepID=UPI0023DAA629|nr:UDP-N-acetylmuramate dehydrogenase [Albimonas sp. CAU 1670]MDF2233996.1 UDP-N-acetylmuramate dehydrogenase [Albimonas sp. CAU 1670]